MVTRIAIAVLALAALAAPEASDAQQRAPQTRASQGKDNRRVYTWVDDKGVVHYGDSIPPEYANRDRNLLNRQGVRVGFEEGEVTEEERAEIARKKAEAEAQAAAQAEIDRHDKMLLQTYITVADIEDLRDRRLELLESQIKVTELYLTNLRKRLVMLQEEASPFKPYNANPDAPQIPPNLALDLSRTTSSIANYEKMLSKTRADQMALRTSFDEDIARFRELKGG
ncbi:MAG TPA: DUF4124 domain-containing protein [Gammaproteobacteria bacterium]|nr:DUF4124 domain-containing protein [Gammaproteobacteria bacterium]